MSTEYIAILLVLVGVPFFIGLWVGCFITGIRTYKRLGSKLEHKLNKKKV